MPFERRIIWRETESVTEMLPSKTVFDDVRNLFLTGGTVPGALHVGITAAQLGHRTREDLEALHTRQRQHGTARVPVDRNDVGFDPERGQSPNEPVLD